jgi:hypothetical protein
MQSGVQEIHAFTATLAMHTRRKAALFIISSALAVVSIPEPCCEGWTRGRGLEGAAIMTPLAPL